MITKVQKWGNSLALRIPKSIAEEMGLKTASPLDMIIEKGKIVLIPAKKKNLSLKEMVAMINEENIHAEISSGGPIGNESW